MQRLGDQVIDMLENAVNVSNYLASPALHEDFRPRSLAVEIEKAREN